MIRSPFIFLSLPLYIGFILKQLIFLQYFHYTASFLLKIINSVFLMDLHHINFLFHFYLLLLSFLNPIVSFIDFSLSLVPHFFLVYFNLHYVFLKVYYTLLIFLYLLRKSIVLKLIIFSLFSHTVLESTNVDLYFFHLLESA